MFNVHLPGAHDKGQPLKHCGKEKQKVYNFISRRFPAPLHLIVRWVEEFQIGAE